MAPRIFKDNDVDLSLIQSKTVSFIGYGNQGFAQAQNLRDNGVKNIVIGNIDDKYRKQAEKDGFKVVSLHEAAKVGDIVFLLIPDEVQPQVFNEDVAPYMKKGSCLVVASGYNVAFKLLNVPNEIDIGMAAPRMIGAGVRSRFISRQGYPCFVSVERDASGNAWPLILSVARGIGATLMGAIESSAIEEAGIDLFAEQALFPAVWVAYRVAYEVLSKAGFSDEAILTDMYLSGEPAEIMERAAKDGIMGQMKFHSRTSQYGQLRAMLNDDGQSFRETFRKVLNDDILSGKFAKHWSEVTADGEKRLNEMIQKASADPVLSAEKRVLDRYFK